MRVVPLISGGLDSTVLVYREALAKGNDIFPMFVNYGQRNVNREAIAVKSCYRELSERFEQMKGRKLPQIKYLEKELVAPHAILFYGFQYADSIGAKYVVIGSHQSEQTSKLVYDATKQLEFSSDYTIKLRAPFSMIDKSEVVKMGKILQVPFNKTYGCIEGKKYPCGVCPTCVERRQAFKDAQLEDETIYADDPRAKKGCCG